MSTFSCLVRKKHTIPGIIWENLYTFIVLLGENSGLYTKTFGTFQNGCANSVAPHLIVTACTISPGLFYTSMSVFLRYIGMSIISSSSIWITTETCFNCFWLTLLYLPTYPISCVVCLVSLQIHYE